MPAARLFPVLLCLLATAIPAGAQRSRPRGGTPLTPGRILVSGFESDALHVYRASDGAPRGVIEAIPGAQALAYGPDGLLYVAAEQVDRIVRVDVEAQAQVDVFVGDDPLTAPDESGGLDGPTAVLFGSDGELYVASFESDAILRFHGRTGAFRDVFVPPGTGGLNGPDAGTVFGPDGDLYVPSFWNDRVLRYDGRSGAYLGEFVSAGEGSLDAPRALVFHGQEALVASSGNNRILRFSRQGDFLGIFATTDRPYCLAFHPEDGNLYVTNPLRDNVRIFDGRTGALIRRVVANGSNGLEGAVFLSFVR
jgi:DNA-binding beta-propeller fold protein YncE